MPEPVLIRVQAERDYEVHIGPGSIAHLASMLSEVDQVAIVYQR